MFLIWSQRFASFSLRLLLFLFISVFLFINCLLINARWYIHFGLYIISTYLVLDPLFKDHRGLVDDCFLFVDNIKISKEVFLHFLLFCIESVGFPNQFYNIYFIFGPVSVFFSLSLVRSSSFRLINSFNLLKLLFQALI